MNWEKERYREQKSRNEQRRMKIKFLNALKDDTVLKLRLGQLQDADGVSLIEKLHGIEVNLAKVVGNKYNSEHYSFEPHVGINRQQRRKG